MLARDAHALATHEPVDAEQGVDAGGLRWRVQALMRAHSVQKASHQGDDPRQGDDPQRGDVPHQGDVPRQGDTPRWLLLHGTGASTHSWRDIAPRLAAHGHVLMPDLPGHGGTQALPRSQRSMAGMARALGDLLAARDFVPTCVVGHSAGAAVALRLALDGGLPAGCTIVGLNAALLPFGGVAGALYAPLARLLAINPLVPRLAAWRARDIAGVRRLIDATGSRLDDAGVAGYARLLSRPGHVAGVLAMMASWDLDALSRDLRALRLPLHLLVGECDRAVPPAQADVVASRVAGARVHRLPGLGHLMHEEAPALLAGRIVALAA